MKKDPRSQSPSHSGLVAFEFEGDIADETVAHERIGTLRLSEADWEAWNRHPRLGGDWRWRDASNNLRPG